MLFQIFSLLVMAIFYCAYFLKSLAQRKQGIKTNLLGKGKTGFPKVIELALKVVTFTLPILELVSILTNSTALPTPVRVLGFLLAVMGLVFFLLSLTTIRDNWRAGVPQKKQTELVTAGVYSISRNPAFLGFDLIDLGILLTFFNLPLFCLTFAAVLLFHLQIVNVEEDFLVANFGEEYLEYKKKVRRYFGRR